MEKIVKIGDKKVTLKATAALPVRYKNEFGTEFFDDLSANVTNLSSVNYKMIYVMAKTADSNLPDYETWLDSFEYSDFKMNELISIASELLRGNVKTSTKN